LQKTVPVVPEVYCCVMSALLRDRCNLMY